MPRSKPCVRLLAKPVIRWISIEKCIKPVDFVLKRVSAHERQAIKGQMVTMQQFTKPE